MKLKSILRRRPGCYLVVVTHEGVDYYCSYGLDHGLAIHLNYIEIPGEEIQRIDSRRGFGARAFNVSMDALKHFLSQEAYVPLDRLRLASRHISDEILGCSVRAKTVPSSRLQMTSEMKGLRIAQEKIERVIQEYEKSIKVKLGMLS